MDILATGLSVQCGLGAQLTLSHTKRLVYVSCDPQAATKNLVDLCRMTSKTYDGEPFHIAYVRVRAHSAGGPLPADQALRVGGVLERVCPLGAPSYAIVVGLDVYRFPRLCTVVDKLVPNPRVSNWTTYLLLVDS
ncbi:tRNA (uracil-5-)-methyltransferase A-like protein [Aphelenchoides avenae]|nr:tRNA (uracil-5-)-methyltransferase A-like protein [Aphelenchus avenae]